jgi:hypothetical protein
MFWQIKLNASSTTVLPGYTQKCVALASARPPLYFPRRITIHYSINARPPQAAGRARRKD